jgi:hypothetical protein
MASHTLNVGDRIPVGGTVTAYAASNWLHHELPPTGDPKGSSAGSGEVQADGTVEITGLDAETRYYATGTGHTGSRVYIGFTTAIPGGTASAIRWMTQAEYDDITPDDNNGIGVRAVNANQIFLTRMRIDNHPNFAIHGSGVIGFNLDNSVLDGTNGNELVNEEGAIRLRSDVERKRLFGLGMLESSKDKDMDLYGAEASARTYDRLFALARPLLRCGYPVILDAAFLKREERRQALARDSSRAIGRRVLDAVIGALDPLDSIRRRRKAAQVMADLVAHRISHVRAAKEMRTLYERQRRI